MSGGNINAAKCVAYLVGVGVPVSADTAAAWLATEKDTRERRRVANRERKKSCGHFRKETTDVYSEQGHHRDTHCLDCGRSLKHVKVPRRPRPGGPGEPMPVEKSA